MSFKKIMIRSKLKQCSARNKQTKQETQRYIFALFAFCLLLITNKQDWSGCNYFPCPNPPRFLFCVFFSTSSFSFLPLYWFLSSKIRGANQSSDGQATLLSGYILQQSISSLFLFLFSFHSNELKRYQLRQELFKCCGNFFRLSLGPPV